MCKAKCNFCVGKDTDFLLHIGIVSTVLKLTEIDRFETIVFHPPEEIPLSAYSFI